MDLDDRPIRTRFLIHDRDATFSGPLDEVFRSEGMRVILTPIRAPTTTAYAERFISPVRAECPDWTLILGRKHLEWTLRTCAEHYSEKRPHRAIALGVPKARAENPMAVRPRDVHRRDSLGGVIREYGGVAP